MPEVPNAVPDKRGPLLRAKCLCGGSRFVIFAHPNPFGEISALEPVCQRCGRPGFWISDGLIEYAGSGFVRPNRLPARVHEGLPTPSEREAR